MDGGTPKSGNPRPRRSLHLLASIATLVVLVAPAAAHASPGSSLAKCQKAADVEGAKLVQGTVKALTKCLSRIATEYLKEGGSGAGATVRQSTQVANLSAWCGSFGGDGSIDSIAEWVDCQAAAGGSGARLAVATQHPRTLEWLAAVRPSIAAMSPTPTDALAALVQHGLRGNVRHATSPAASARAQRSVRHRSRQRVRRHHDLQRRRRVHAVG